MRQAAAIAILLLLISCSPRPGQPVTSPTLTDEAATLSSLEQVDDYPLYTMYYRGTYSTGARPAPAAQLVAAQSGCAEMWGCSLFAALGDENDRLLGRNFDWQFSPALLLFTDPPDGYASVSMVDIAYLGFDGERSKGLEELSAEQRKPLLDAPQLPFDGMNEKGLAIGMAAVPPGNMLSDPGKQTLDELQVIREMLDHAATVDEAVQILGSYNIDMGSVPIHYLIASASGQSVTVEFYEGKMHVFRNETAWQTATNFLIASTNGHPGGRCWRYDRINARLAGLQGRIRAADAMGLLEDVSQENTQWSVVYHVTSGEIKVVMGRGYAETTHVFQLERSGP